MSKRLLKLCSIMLTLVMLFNMLPHQVLADTLTTEEMNLTSPGVSSGKVEFDTSALDVVEEVTENRTEFSKEFRMSNGLHMSAVYDSAVHYDDNGTWKEIDNTLVAAISEANAVYTNTAGVWDITFPQQLSASNYITVTKDGYTLRFGMAGELSNNGAVVMSENAATRNALEQSDISTLAIQEAQLATAQVQQVDTATILAEAEHPETVADKLNARLQYSNVYNNTNVIYDLQSNMLKESIVISRYDSDLRGYRYTLDVGTMIPVLNDDNSIWFYDSNHKEVIMAMPAPYIFDAEDARTEDVRVILQGSGSTYTLIYLLPVAWLADENRSWPVVLDPVITADIDPHNIRDISVSENYVFSQTSGSLSCGWDQYWGKSYFYVKYTEIPALMSSDVIVHAIMELYKFENSVYTDPVEVHKVNGTWESESLTWTNSPGFNSKVEDFANVGTSGYYYWNVTDIVRDWYAGQNTGMMFKLTDAVETGGVYKIKNFYSSDYGWTYRPSLYVFFRNNIGLESYWDYTASAAGRAGIGYVNQYTGNLVWVHNDIGFGGNRMPVTINHIYNVSESNLNLLGLGYGWRTNFNQFVYQWNQDSSYYLWEDADGTIHYFSYDSYGTYKDEDGLELTLTTTGSGTTTYCITDNNGNKSYFDAYGRLSRLENNQATPSSINITYRTTSGYLISSITDGAGRVYSFEYSGDNLLSRISYMGTGSSEVSYVTFGYTGSNLTSITDKDGETTAYEYNGHLLTSATDIDGYKVTYTYSTPVNTWQPYRILSIQESDDGTLGGAVSIQYSHNQTTFTDHNENRQIVQFNNWGNTVSVQDGEGHAQYAQYATETNLNGGKGNQLTVASKLQNTVGNMLSDNSFELGTKWSEAGATVTNSTDTAYYGSKSLKIVSSGSGGGQISFTADAGKTYTFSAYVKTGSSPAYLTLGGISSETLAANSGWTRLEVSYTNSSGSAQSITAQIKNTTAGTTYMDCVQAELAPTASRYNLITNGDFRDTTGWSSSSGRTTIASDALAAPQLNPNVYKLSGTYTSQNRIYQSVGISGQAGDTLVLAGWAMGNATPLTQIEGNTYDSSAREFGILAVFNYTDGTTSPILVSSDTENAKAINEAKTNSFKLRFNPDVDNWQYAAIPIVAEKNYSSITIYLAFDHNANEAYFDGIQLYKEQFGSSYTYNEDGTVQSVVDLQKQTTQYKYKNNNLTEIIQSNGAKVTYEYDDYHNVISATSAEGLTYSFTYDTYGNNTKVSITSGGVTMSSSATYADGNRLATTTDAANKVTTYNYDANTNVLLSVKYPNDTDATKTVYTYDDMYRLASAAASTDTQTLSANYTYADDMLTKITTGSTTYNFAYGSFGLRSEISIGDKALATYNYTNDRNNYLQTLAYGNGDSVQYTYDQLGRVVVETYEDGDTVSYAYDNDGALATVTDSATGRKTTYYYDFTDRLMKYVESGNGFSHSVGYTYNDRNQLMIEGETIGGTLRKTSFTYDEDSRVAQAYNNYTTSRRNYAYNNYGLLRSKTSYHGGSEVVKESYVYRMPTSTTVTSQVSTMTHTAANYSATFKYRYDSNGNIVSVSNGTNTTTYTYDSQNQLLREDNQAGGFTHVWTYDDGGNITSRKEYDYTTGGLGTLRDTVSYSYDDTAWGDLLTAYDGVGITHDDIGNPTNDGTWTYTWEHGRELASMTGGGTTWDFTYDVNGMRTKRTNGSTTYEYTYNGDRLTQLVINTNGTVHTMYFVYDADGPMAVNANGTTYYYVKNLQGDITALVNKAGTAVVEYTYDAWGNIISVTGDYANGLGKRNPLRYRGYVYDVETELYYLQSRYYDPEIGRFSNADVFVSTDQGILGNNMFAYCLNNAVRYRDNDGTLAHDAIDINDEDVDENHHPDAGGGGFWNGFRQSLDNATRGLDMASGQRSFAGAEKHHVASNKNKKYTPEYEELAGRYNMELDSQENTVVLGGHKGRHTNAYHDFVLFGMRELDKIADGNKELFTTGYKILVDYVKNNSYLPYAKYK